MAVFTDYSKPNLNRGSGNCYIDCNVSISFDFKVDLVNYIIGQKHKKSLKNINVWKPFGDNFIVGVSLPLTDNWKKYLSSYIDQQIEINKENYITCPIDKEHVSKYLFDDNIRKIEFEYDDKSYIRGLRTSFGFNTLSVDEANDLRECVVEFANKPPLDEYLHHISEDKWIDSAYTELSDPVSHSLYVDPVIASDGFTYSKKILDKLFEIDNPISPLTREKLRRIGSINEYGRILPGIPNIKIQQLLDKFKEGKLRISTDYDPIHN
jgi:hypothetical protein